MTSTVDAFQAGIDGSHSAFTKGEFADAIRTVVNSGYSDAEAKDWIDVIAVEYNRLGVINNGTYASLRSKINSDKAVATELFTALQANLIQLPETRLVTEALKLSDLRVERDDVNDSIDTVQAFKTGATRQVKDALQLGIDQLRGYKESVRDQIRAITGDPDN